MEHVRSISPQVVRIGTTTTCATPPPPFAFAQSTQLAPSMVTHPVTYAAPPPAPMPLAPAPPAVVTHAQSGAHYGGHPCVAMGADRRRREVGRIGMGHKALRSRDLSFGGAKGQARMIITALDYKGTSNALTCTVDGDNMASLARACGVQDIVQIYDTKCTKWTIEQEIIRIGQSCLLNPNDVFIFCYAGHGTSVTDYNGDEIDNKDEAYVLCDQMGQAIPPSNDSLMTDDEFCLMVTTHIPAHTTVFIISDCCHSGTICDFKKHVWADRKAISISGCRDTQTSGDTGHGGICTHSMLMAVANMQRKGKSTYNVFDLFAEILRVDDEVFDSPQDITVNCDPEHRPRDFDWPLVPLGPYSAPYNKHGGSATGGAVTYSSSTPPAPYAQATAVAGYPEPLLAAAAPPYGGAISSYAPTTIVAAPGATAGTASWAQLLGPTISYPSSSYVPHATTYTTSAGGGTVGGLSSVSPSSLQYISTVSGPAGNKLYY